MLLEAFLRSATLMAKSSLGSFEIHQQLPGLAIGAERLGGEASSSPYVFQNREEMLLFQHRQA